MACFLLKGMSPPRLPLPHACTDAVKQAGEELTFSEDSKGHNLQYWNNPITLYPVYIIGRSNP